MPTINYNAALPAFSSISGRSSIDINKWVSELKFNISSLIKSLFANNEQGFFYDPNDLSTMYQDAAGTVPVTGVGQAVGLIRDKSGRNNHAFQTTSASRPILRQNAVTGANYLEFDGTDDSLVTNSIDFSTTDEVSLFSCSKAKAVPGPDYQTLLDFNLTNDGGFQLAVPHQGSRAFFASRGASGTAFAYSAAIDWNLGIVLSGRAKISTDMLQLRTNGHMTASATDQGSGTYGNKPMCIGRRVIGDRHFKEELYSLIGIGRLTTDAETIALEKLIAKNTGVTLSV
jgi:hypothetical protein